ncbi:transcriptional regulator [Vreelandella aquamarina]|uniref:Helix-turn-helix n=1 Tax=Vreelandella aquamarina TaxID=77097 RepID=A0A1N6EML7_9GAMM|nr:helix-turn-helix transcriptional regulator [Halomonas meridiana]GED47364.1 transcriptional regulator [Halomonas meridiana]SIN84339.1 Helix-turn-helix [Halomonas meridiana]SIN88262.1 Helix-turn-helix [Halomonas meridiana]SIO51111.1 Helix-turn-helix [Halomonas meridiana]
MKELAAAIGKSIREKRRANGLSQDRFALVASIDRSYVGRIERGEVSITIEMLYKISATLQCEPTTLLPRMASICSLNTRKSNKNGRNQGR